MNTFRKHIFSFKTCTTIIHQSIFSSVFLFAFFVFSTQSALAQIDETLPDSIPKEIISDWEEQDATSAQNSNISNITQYIVNNLPAEYTDMYNDALKTINITDSTAKKYKRYILACHYRRIAKLKPFSSDIKELIFAKHHNFGAHLQGCIGNIGNDTDYNWIDSSAMCMMKMTDYYSRHEYIYRQPEGVVRDPCISFDGKKVLFAMSEKKGSGYKIYEMEIGKAETIRQLTFDPDSVTVVSDFEPCYLQNGDICFTSSRCFGMRYDYPPLATFNLYIMNKDGKYMRRITFDMMQTLYPVLLDNGRILYTRFESNDRTRSCSGGLFCMNPDGTDQREYFGNQTSWPYSKIHARPIPNSGKVAAIASGLHGPYSGELMIIDNQIGLNGKQSIQMIAPKRETKGDTSRPDNADGDVKFLFQTPLPLDENSFIVSYRKSEQDSVYKLYFMDAEGNRELLAWDNQSLSQPVFCRERITPAMPSSNVDYTDNMATCKILNVYLGDGLKSKTALNGIAKKIRVVKIDYRLQNGSIGYNTFDGDQSTGSVYCPVSMYGTSFNTKTVLGEAPVYSDGSASFQIPARTPVYFQVIDSMGYCIATMRSWSTLMPGETFTCTGCHVSSLVETIGLPFLAGEAKPLEKNMGIEGIEFDYRKFVQPILDKNCISCHKAGHSSGLDLSGDLIEASDIESSGYSKGYKDSRRSWTRSYLELVDSSVIFFGNRDSLYVYVPVMFLPPEQQQPYSIGSSKSRLATSIINADHHDVSLTKEEKAIISCWIDLACPHAGNYIDYLNTEDSLSFVNLILKRSRYELFEKQNIDEFIADGQYNTSAQKMHKFDNRSAATNAVSKINYISTQRILVIDHAMNSRLDLIDLRGKVLFEKSFSQSESKGVFSIRLPQSLARGIYIARLSGQNLAEQKIISVIK